MTEVLWLVDFASSATSWNSADGVVRTYGRPGVRMGCTVEVRPLDGRGRDRLLALLAAMRDPANRVWRP